MSDLKGIAKIECDKNDYWQMKLVELSSGVISAVISRMPSTKENKVKSH